MSLQDITIIIVTYNSEKVIESCLNALPREQRIIVLDNGSSDNTIELVSKYGFVDIVKNDNIGYGKAANLGLSMTTTPYALLLNPDVKVNIQSIDAMVECTKKHPDIGIMGAQMLRYEGGKKTYQDTYAFDQQGVCYSDWIVGALMLFNMQALARVGKFDENIFLFFEETDLCDRFIEAGYKLAIYKDAEAEHEWGTSSTKSVRTTKIRAWHSAWSRAYYYKKHYGLGKSLRKSISKLLKNIINIIENLLLMRKNMVIINVYEIMGLLSFFIGIKAYKTNGAARIA